MQLGSASVTLSLGIFAFASAFLYMPAKVGDAFTQELFQQIAWTRDEIPEKVKARNAVLAQHRAFRVDPIAAPFSTAVQATAWAGNVALGQALGIGLPNAQDSSIFCMETAVKLFHWSRLAYQDMVSVIWIMDGAHD